MPFIGNAPARVPLTSADITDGIITSAKIVDGTIVNADINASAAIASTKLSGVASDYVLLASTDASSSATVSFDGYFSSTYKNYIVFWSELYGATDGVDLRIRLRKSNADITGSVYSFIYYFLNLALSTGSTSSSVGGTGRTSFIRIADWNGDNGGTYRESGYVIIQNANISAYKNITGVSHTFSSDLATYNATFFNSVLEDSASLSGITFYKTSGNIAAGNFKLYGLK